MNFTIQEIINKAVQKDEKDYQQKSWHSSALGSCLTGAYLVRKGLAKKEFDERTLRVFKVGNMFEEWLVNLIGQQTDKFETQVRCEWPEMDLTGYADLTINGLVYEIKTINSMGFKYLKEDAKEQHKMQLWTYLKCLGKKEGRILYLEKDCLRVKEFPLTIDDPIQKKVVEELTILNNAWAKGLPPAPITDKDDWRYKYCSVHGQCLKQKKYADN
jgi:hypothetical protein